MFNNQNYSIPNNPDSIFIKNKESSIIKEKTPFVIYSFIYFNYFFRMSFKMEIDLK